MSNAETPRQILTVCELLAICSAHDEPDWSKVSAGDFERIMAWLFRLLDTLDSKTSHLLGHMSLIVAAQSILIGVAVALGFAGGLVIFLLVMLLVPLVGSLSALWIFKVKSLFLDWRATPSRPQPISNSIKDECFVMASVCDQRVSSHQRVWHFSIASLVAIILSILIILAQLHQSIR